MKTQKKSARAGWLRRGVLILLLIAAAGLGWRHLPRQAAPEIQPTPAPTQQTVDERDVREKAYDKDVQALQALVDNENADEQIRANAAEQLQKLIAAHQCEIAVETALKKAGYEPCLVLMSGDAVTVMLDASDIDAQTSAAILSMVTAHAEVGAENIRIMSR